MYHKKLLIVLLLFVGLPTFAQKIEQPIMSLLDKTDNNNITTGSSKNDLRSLLQYFKDKDNVFVNVSKNDLEYIKTNYPKEVSRSIEVANQIVDKYFLYREPWDMERTNIPYQFKKDIDWSINPFGDPEWTWMLNRHKYWTHLGKAYFFTKKEKYAKTFINQIEHWIENNPLSSLENIYKNSGAWRRIEAGIRCKNWITTFEYIKNSKHVTPEFLEKFLSALHLHGEYLNHSFGSFSKTSNWGVLEYNGLFILSIYLKEFKSAKDWQKNAIDRLTYCANLQVLEDGSHWEHSPTYHNEVMSSFLDVYFLSKQNKIELPKSLIKKIKDQALVNVKWQKPNYNQPLLGDSDDVDTRDLLTLAAYLFQNSVLKSRAFKALDLDNYMLLGSKGNKVYKELNEETPSFHSAYLPSSGDLFMRDSWEENAQYASLHLKKLAGGHAHDDLLSFTIFANGKDYIVDNGRYTYVNNKWRRALKESFAHNTLSVDDLPNSILNGSWASEFEAWGDGAYVKLGNNFDYGEGINYAYSRLEDPVLMKRRMLYLKPNVWLLFDSFQAQKRHKYSQYFNFPNKNVIVVDNKVKTTYSEKNIVINQLKEVNYNVLDSWYSTEYNLKIPSKKIEVYKEAEGFASFITLIHFEEDRPKEVKRIPVYTREGNLLSDNEAEAVGITINNTDYTLLVTYKSSKLSNHFFKINDELVHGEIVLMEKNKTEKTIHVIK